MTLFPLNVVAVFIIRIPLLSRSIYLVFLPPEMYVCNFVGYVCVRDRDRSLSGMSNTPGGCSATLDPTC